MVNAMKSVVILGAGAMGAAYASMFYDMDPACVALAADGDRCQRLKADGLMVNDRHYSFPVLAPEDPAPPADLIIVALKHQHLAEALPILRNRVGEDTLFLSVMNGLDSEAIIGEVYGSEKVLLAVAVGIDAQRNGNVIHFSKGGTIFFGEVDNATLTGRVKAVQALLDRAGIGHKTPEDMIRTLWWKYMINVGINQASALLSAPYGLFQTSDHAAQIMEAAMREVMVLAQAAQVDLVEQDIANWYTFMNTLHPEGRTSMLQDVEAGRPTEVDIFAGKAIELGKTCGIPTPVNEILYHAIKIIEGRVARG